MIDSTTWISFPTLERVSQTQPLSFFFLKIKKTWIFRYQKQTNKPRIFKKKKRKLITEMKRKMKENWEEEEEILQLGVPGKVCLEWWVGEPMWVTPERRRFGSNLMPAAMMMMMMMPPPPSFPTPWLFSITLIINMLYRIKGLVHFNWIWMEFI